MHCGSCELLFIAWVTSLCHKQVVTRWVASGKWSRAVEDTECLLQECSLNPPTLQPRVCFNSHCKAKGAKTREDISSDACPSCLPILCSHLILTLSLLVRATLGNVALGSITDVPQETLGPVLLVEGTRVTK